MWNRSSTYQRFYSNFQRKISSWKKGKSRIKSEKLPPRRSTLGKISLRYEFMQIMWFLWRSYRGCKNCIFPWKSIWKDIFDWVWRNIFCRIFSRCFFSWAKEKYTWKSLSETQSMKIQVKLGETPVRKNVGKLMQTVGSRRLTPKLAKSTYYPILKIQS